MKAIYQKPVTDIVNVKLTPLMNQSPLGPVEEGFDPGQAPETGETSGNLSRRSIWDDED